MELTFKEAAALIGHRSRSTLYRWQQDGLLKHAGYLRGKPGRWRIESDPGEGRRPFAQWAAAVCGPQGPHRREEPPEPAPQPAPPASDPVAVDLEFWAEYGRTVGPDEPPLSDAAFWEHLAGMLGGLMGEAYTAGQVAELTYQLDTLRESVAAGARWDPDRWDAASCRSLLEDSEVREGICPHSRAELQALAAGGRLPPELQAQADEALAAYRARDEAAA